MPSGPKSASSKAAGAYAKLNFRPKKAHANLGRQRSNKLCNWQRKYLIGHFSNVCFLVVICTHIATTFTGTLLLFITAYFLIFCTNSYIFP